MQILFCVILFECIFHLYNIINYNEDMGVKRTYFRKGFIIMKDLTVIYPMEIHMKRLNEIGMFHHALNHVVLEDDKVVGFFAGQIGNGIYYNLEDNEMFLEYLTVETPQKQGYGRRIVDAIFKCFPNIDTIIAETSEDNKGFWERLGATIPEDYVDDCREIYEFVLLKKNFIGSTVY